jgi:ABC-type glycerol-3-phosphate transport system substrate-binding protein
MKAAIPALAALLLLAACGGGQSPAESTADNLEEAAEQSDPAAAEVLDNAADAVRETEGTGVPANPNAMAQNAMAEAGNAQAETNSQ